MRHTAELITAVVGVFHRASGRSGLNLWGRTNQRHHAGPRRASCPGRRLGNREYRCPQLCARMSGLVCTRGGCHR
jgi:hypothetical protein